MLTRDEMLMMERCAQEMEMLRSQNKLMGAQLAVVDVFARVVGLTPKSEGFSEDIVHKLKRALKKYKDEEAVEKLRTMKQKVEEFMNDKTGEVPNPLVKENMDHVIVKET